jgi:hypothetical protein
MAITNNHSQEEMPLEQLTALGAGGGPNRLERDTAPRREVPMEPQSQMAPIAQVPQAMPMQQPVSPLAQPVMPESPQQQQAPGQQQQQQGEQGSPTDAKLDLNNNFRLPYTGQQEPQPLQGPAPITTRRDQAIGNVAYTNDGVKIENYNPKVPIDNQKKIDPSKIEAVPGLIERLIQNPDLVDEVWDEISG